MNDAGGSQILECAVHWQLSMKLFCFLLIPVLFYTFVYTLTAQTLLFRDYSTADGLPDSRIAPIIQDHRGYLWFGAQAGLTRYDGRDFVTYGPANDIPGIFGRSIMEDRYGAIWFACSGFKAGAVTRILHDTMLTIDHQNGLQGLQPFAVVEGEENDVWVCTEAGLERIRFLDSSRTRWIVDTRRDTTLTAMFRTRSGVLFYTDNRGLFKIVHGSSVPVFIAKGNDWRWHVRPSSFLERRNGELLFGGYNEAYVLRRDTLLRLSRTNGVPERGVWCFQEDVDGTLYAGTMNGLYRVEGTGDRFTFTKITSFGDGIIYDMCLDAEGNLWFASAPGLRRLLRVAEIMPFPQSRELAHAGFGPLKLSFDGSLYLGSRNSGIYVLRRGGLSVVVPPPPFAARTISALLPLSNGDFLAGLWRSGLFVRRSHRTSIFTVGDGLPSDDVHALEASRRIIIGTAAGLATMGQDGRVRPVNPDADGPSIFDLLHGVGDTIWAGTNRGIRMYRDDPDSLVALTVPSVFQPLAHLTVYAVFRDVDSRLWFGTDGGGVFTARADTLVHFGREDGMIGDRVFAIGQDSLRRLWFGTSTGLTCFDGNCFRSLGFAEGFGEIGMHGIAVDKDGDVWVSAYPGVVRLKPMRYFRSDDPAPLFLTGMLVDGVSVPLGLDLVLSPGVAVIAFHFAAMSFTDERNVRYRYKLECFDKDWSPPTSLREVRYTHLPAGSYTFSVIGRTADGVWSRHAVQASFEILPSVWARWWFITLAVAAVVLAIYSLYRYRLTRLLEVERTRARIAMDLHDDIGSTLTRISVMTEVARRQIEADPVVQSYLTRIGDASRDLIESLGDIVWSVDPRHDALQDVIRRIVDFGQEVCEGREVSFETELEGSFEGARLTLDQRRDIYLFFKEGINNVVKHANATHARLRVRHTGRGALIELLDDGVGLPAEPDASRHGLLSLRERGRRAGVAFAVESEPGVGTKISLEVKTA